MFCDSSVMTFYCREAGVGFASSPPLNPQFDCNRTELLKLLLTCFSEAMYLPPTGLLTPLNCLCKLLKITVIIILNVKRKKRHPITEMLLTIIIMSIPSADKSIFIK